MSISSSQSQVKHFYPLPHSAFLLVSPDLLMWVLLSTCLNPLLPGLFLFHHHPLWDSAFLCSHRVWLVRSISLPFSAFLLNPSPLSCKTTLAQRNILYQKLNSHHTWLEPRWVNCIFGPIQHRGLLQNYFWFLSTWASLNRDQLHPLETQALKIVKGLRFP